MNAVQQAVGLASLKGTHIGPFWAWQTDANGLMMIGGHHASRGKRSGIQSASLQQPDSKAALRFSMGSIGSIVPYVP